MSKNNTDIKQRLFKILKTKKLSEQSAMVYVRNIIRLHKISETKVDIFKPTWLTQKLVKTVKANKQQRHLFLAGVKLLQALNKKSGKRWDLWYSNMINSSNAYKNTRAKAQLSDKEVKQIGNTTFHDFCVTVRKMIPLVRRVLAKPLDKTVLKDVLRIQEVVVLLFFCEIPLRNELANLKISNIDKQKQNYFEKNKTGYTLILKDHKTKKSVGSRSHKISKSMARLLNKFIPMVSHVTEHGYLLTSARGNRLTMNGLTKYLLKITKKHFDTAFSSQIIRILFAKHHAKGLKDAIATQKSLGHSNMTTTLSYAKE